MTPRRCTVLSLLLLLLGSGCSVSSTAQRSDATTVPQRPQLPAACDLVAPSEVADVIGVFVSSEPTGRRDQCRYHSERRDEVEITVDDPRFNSPVQAYLGLNPDAQPVENVGQQAAMRVRSGFGELVVVQGPARFFVVVSGQSSSRETLLRLARVAVGRL